MFSGINAIEFSQKFTDNASCYAYLTEKKWGKGYSCSRCGCKDYYKGKTQHHRRCRQCRYDESVTANTLFHDIKMPLLKAFTMAFRISAKKKGMSTVELGTEVGVQQKTAWFFKRKIQSVMKDTAKLQGRVDADETLVGGYAAGKENRGRSLKEKTAVVVAIERLDDDRTGNINFTVVENFEKATLKYALQDMIETATPIRADQLSSYEAMKTEMPLETVPSKKGSTMEELHKQIMMFKNWLRGTHHKCSEQHFHAYLDEYKFRFNRRNIRKGIFDCLIAKMMNAVPVTYKNLKNLCAYST